MFEPHHLSPQETNSVSVVRLLGSNFLVTQCGLYDNSQVNPLGVERGR